MSNVIGGRHGKLRAVDDRSTTTGPSCAGSDDCVVYLRRILNPNAANADRFAAR
jgi:hypothetical protein